MIVPKILPPLKYLKECFLYELATGYVYWKRRPKKHFNTQREWRRWNTRYAGVRAFKNCGDKTKSKLDGRYYSGHRIIWKLRTGKEPPAELDHKNRVAHENTWSNIRKATRSQNLFNRRCWGKSGHTGIFKEGSSWRAHIQKDGVRKFLGTFKSKAEALAVRLKAEKDLYGTFERCV